MSDAWSEFLDLYDEHRVRDQMSFYATRTEEYDRSSRQLGLVNEVFLVLAAGCGAVGAAWSDQSLLLGLLAAGLAAAAGAVTAWGGVIGFSANAELYRAASAGLAHLRPERPDPRSPSQTEIERYLVAVEEILLGEVRTWGEKWGKEEGVERSG